MADTDEPSREKDDKQKQECDGCDKSSDSKLSHGEENDQLSNGADEVDDELGNRLASLTIKSRASEELEPFERLARQLKNNNFKKIVVLTGAGVSVSAGIPDFRTPGTGLYDNLQKYNLPYPEAVFDLNFYKRNQQPFLRLAKELWPVDGGDVSPTITHCFVKLLEEKGYLLRCYTQNIDGLEVLAGVSPEKVMECHGHFRSASCVRCHSPFDAIEFRDMITSVDHQSVQNVQAPRCKIKKCKGLVKPDIVFFGEGLPNRFFTLMGGGDLDDCDLLIVMGTSLMVHPVAAIPDYVSSTCPRLLVNRELVGSFNPKGGRDIFMAGDCDDSIRELCRIAGWEKELYKIYNNLPKQRRIEKDK